LPKQPQQRQTYHCEEVLINGHAAKEGIPKGRRWKLESSSVPLHASDTQTSPSSSFVLNPKIQKKRFHQKFTSAQLPKNPNNLNLF
jgi:hypothetical protein